MPYKRIILEMGTGNDLHGESYTKAACRAVQDAIHHSSISIFQTLNLNRNDMRVEVTVGVQQPTQIDKDAVAEQIPYGDVVVKVVEGGLNVAGHEPGTVSVIASAAVAAYIDLPDEKFRL